MQIRQATPADHEGIAEILYSAGPELYDFIYMTPTVKSTDFIRFEFESGQGFCGYRNVTVAEKDGQVVGTGCFFDGDQYKRLVEGSTANIFKFYGKLEAIPVLTRCLHTGSVMHEPARDELYLSNFGVRADARSSGIGSALIKAQLEQARAKGYVNFVLDVSDRNPRAQALYTRLGLTVTKNKRFTGQREGIDVPNSLQMELRL